MLNINILTVALGTALADIYYMAKAPLLIEDIVIKPDDDWHTPEYLLAMDLNTPTEVLVGIFNDPKTWAHIKHCTLRNPNMSAEILAKSANSTDWYIRGLAANNPSTPAKILTKLSGDDISNVRYCAARNPNLPMESLLRLVEDNDYYVRQVAVMHQNCPEAAKIWVSKGGFAGLTLKEFVEKMDHG
jgi:hypothetical protein